MFFDATLLLFRDFLSSLLIAFSITMLMLSPPFLYFFFFFSIR